MKNDRRSFCWGSRLVPENMTGRRGAVPPRGNHWGTPQGRIGVYHCSSLLISVYQCHLSVFIIIHHCLSVLFIIHHC